MSRGKRQFWAESYDRELRDVLAMQSDVVQSIAQKVQVTVPGEEHSRLVATRGGIQSKL
jgi:hypothetical protein